MSIIYQKKIFNGDITLNRKKFLIIGDSSAVFAINAKLIPGAISLANQAGSPVEEFYNLKRFINKFGKPNVLILGFRYNSQNYIDRKNAFWNFFMKAHFYNLEEAKEIYNNFLKTNFFHRNTAYSTYKIKYLLYKYYFFPLFLPELKALYNQPITRHKSNYYFLNNLITNFGSIVIDKKNKIKLNKHAKNYYTGQFTPNSSFDLYLNKIISLANANNIPTIYAFIPLSLKLKTSETTLYLKNTRKHIKKNFDHLNHIYFKTLFLPATYYFSDGLHMNSIGSDYYTNQIIKKILKH